MLLFLCSYARPLLSELFTSGPVHYVGRSPEALAEALWIWHHTAHPSSAAQGGAGVPPGDLLPARCVVARPSLLNNHKNWACLPPERTRHMSLRHTCCRSPMATVCFLDASARKVGRCMLSCDIPVLYNCMFLEKGGTIAGSWGNGA